MILLCLDWALLKSFSKIFSNENKEIMDEAEMIKEAASELLKCKSGIFAEVTSVSELKKTLSDNINHLITNDFSRLITILYRMDVSEEKLKKLLPSATNTSAGDIIAEMIIERQKEKIKTKKIFSANNSFGEEEKW